MRKYLLIIILILSTITLVGAYGARYIFDKTTDIFYFGSVTLHEVSSMAGTGLVGTDTELQYDSNYLYNQTETDALLINKVDISLIRGSFHESFNALVTSDGDSVIMNIEQSGGGDLTMQFSDGQTILDCTPADTVILTIGSDASPQDNFIYVLQSTKALTKSTSDFPTSVEHIKVGYFLVPSAGFVQADGAYINQNHNDPLSGTDNMGHLLHMSERLRKLGAIYYSGMVGNGTDGYLTPTSSNVELKVTAGVAYQMHRHAISAFDTSTGDTVLVKNWKNDSYHDISNLFDITADSGGNSIGTNKYFNLVIWGVVNKSGEYTPMMINLPSGFYNGQSDAENDVSGYDDFTIPLAYSIHSSTGFLIARITIKMGTTWQVVSTRDLRGTTPSTATGGGAGTPVEFADNTFRIFDESDPDKEIAFEASGITTSNTRTITMPDTNVDLGDIATNTAKVTNATHTGEVTGSAGLVLDPTCISGKVDTTIAGADYVLFWDATDSTLKKVDAAELTAGGSSTFLGLTDAPASYSGEAGKYVKVNSGENALEFSTPAGAGDVVGPGSATNENLAAFDGTTGKLIKDSGKAMSDVHASASDNQNLWEEIKTDTGTTTANSTTDILTITGGTDIGVYSDGDTIIIDYTGTTGVGDMLKSTYDPNDDGKIAEAQLKLDVATIDLWKADQILAFRIGNYEYMIDGFINDFTVEDEGIDTALSDTYLYDADGDYYYQEGGIIGGNDSYTVLLAHFDGNDGDITTTDSATGGGAPHTITRNGDVVIDDAQYKWTTSSLFDGTGDYWRIVDSDDWTWSGDFTVDLWFRLNVESGSQCLIVSFTDSNTFFRIIWDGDANEWNCAAMTTIVGGADTLSINTWYHVAFVRNGTSVKIYRDGVEKGSATISGTVNSVDGLVIGAYTGGGSSYLNGWIDELRISKGIARWTSNFSVPTGEYNTSVTDIGNMELYSSENWDIGITPIKIRALIFANKYLETVKLSRLGTGTTMTTATISDTDIESSGLYAYTYEADVSGEASDTYIRIFISESDDATLFIHGWSVAGFE